MPSIAHRYDRRASRRLVSSRSLRSGLVAIVASWGLSSSPIGAQEVLDAVGTGTGTCRAFSAFDSDSFTTFENIATQMCDATFVSGSRFAQAISRVSTVFYREPIVDAVALAEQVDGIQAQVLASSVATLRYDADIEFIANPPFISQAWPLLLTAPWSMSDFDSDGNVAAEVRLTVFDDDGAVFFSDVKVLGVDPDVGQWVLPGESEVDAPFEIRIEAACSANPPDDGLTQCQAILDPLIEFDQARFDAIHGSNSFPLENFLTIVTSANLVPEPGFVSMIGAGLASLSMLARRRVRKDRTDPR